MILIRGMDHRGLKVYKVYINDNLGLTLTYFTARSNLVKTAYCAIPGPDARRAFKGPLVLWFLFGINI